MRLLVITDSYPPHHSGGWELRLKDVFDGLKKRGHEILIITTRCPTNHCNLHVDERMVSRVLYKKSEVPSVKSRIYNDFSIMRLINSTEKKFKPDIVHLSHLGDLPNVIFPYFSESNIPIVYDDGGVGLIYLASTLNKNPYFYKNIDDSIYKKWLKNIILFTISSMSFNLIKTKSVWPKNIRGYFNSEFSMRYAQKNGVPIEKCKVIYSGIDTSIFQYKSRNKIAPPIRILTPGRISPEKGMKDVVYLASRLKEKKLPSNLIMIGKVYSEVYYEEVIREIGKFNLETEITVLPMADHDDLAKLYQEADICFFSSYQRFGLSRVPIESMACGCLVISYGNEGSNEVIQNGKTGYIIPEGNIGAAANIIQTTVENPTTYRHIIQNARDEIEQRHSLEAYINQIEAYLYSVINENN